MLKGVKYSDNASIISTYSEQFGTLAFKVVRSSFRRKARANALCMPLSIVRITFDYHPSRSIHIPREQQILHQPFITSINPIGNAVGLFTVELLTRLLRHSDSDQQLYAYLRGELMRLEQMNDRGLSSFHLQLMSGLLLRLGILPSTDGYKVGHILDFSEGVFRYPWGSSDPIQVAACATLVQFITQPNPEELPLRRDERQALLQLLIDYTAYHFPEVGALNSPEILSQIFE